MPLHFVKTCLPHWKVMASWESGNKFRQLTPQRRECTWQVYFKECRRTHGYIRADTFQDVLQHLMTGIKCTESRMIYVECVSISLKSPSTNSRISFCTSNQNTASCYVWATPKKKYNKIANNLYINTVIHQMIDVLTVDISAQVHLSITACSNCAIYNKPGIKPTFKGNIIFLPSYLRVHA